MPPRTTHSSKCYSFQLSELFISDEIIAWRAWSNGQGEVSRGVVQYP